MVRGMYIEEPSLMAAASSVTPPSSRRITGFTQVLISLVE